MSVLSVPPQTVPRYRRRRPDFVANEPWPTMLKPGLLRLSHPALAYDIPSIAFIAQSYRRGKPVDSPTISEVKVTDQQRPAQAPRVAQDRLQSACWPGGRASKGLQYRRHRLPGGVERDDGHTIAVRNTHSIRHARSFQCVGVWWWSTGRRVGPPPSPPWAGLYRQRARALPGGPSRIAFGMGGAPVSRVPDSHICLLRHVVKHTESLCASSAIATGRPSSVFRRTRSNSQTHLDDHR